MPSLILCQYVFGGRILIHMADGLYQVMTSYLCAGFVIERGRLIMCAPILRKRLGYWKTVARRIGD